jgi:hypothetical protein
MWLKIDFLGPQLCLYHKRMAVMRQKDRRYTQGWGSVIYQPLHICATSTARWLLTCCPELEADLVVALPHTHNTVSTPNFDANNSESTSHTVTATCYWWSCGKECKVLSQSGVGLRGNGACAVAAHSRLQEWGELNVVPETQTSASFPSSILSYEYRATAHKLAKRRKTLVYTIYCTERHRHLYEWRVLWVILLTLSGSQNMQR